MIIVNENLKKLFDILLSNNPSILIRKNEDYIFNIIPELRKSKGFSQLRLAVEMGYSSASYIGRMEIRKNGEHFNLIQLFKIAKILNVSIKDIFEGTDEIIQTKDTNY